MDIRIPPDIADFLRQYLLKLESILPDGTVAAVYLYGSIALESFEAHASDIDFITFLKRNLKREEFRQLKEMHRELRKTRFGKVMDGAYLLESGAGKGNHELPPYPYVSDGRLKWGFHDVNPTTWWIIQNNGIKLAGNLPEFEVSWEAVKETMSYNLNDYWLPKARTGWFFWSDKAVEFSVLTLCRIVCTLEYGVIFPKREAGERALALLDPSWHMLVKEALRIRSSSNAKPLYYSRFKRLNDIQQFILYVRELCVEKYGIN